MLDVLEEEALPARALDLGAHFMDRLRALASPHVREVRGLGLLVGVELKTKVAPVVRALGEASILALPAGATVLRFLPPLVQPPHPFGGFSLPNGQMLPAQQDRSSISRPWPP